MRNVTKGMLVAAVLAAATLTFKLWSVSAAALAGASHVSSTEVATAASQLGEMLDLRETGASP